MAMLKPLECRKSLSSVQEVKPKNFSYFHANISSSQTGVSMQQKVNVDGRQKYQHQNTHQSTIFKIQ